MRTQAVCFVIVQFTIGWREMEAGRRPCRDPVSGSHPRIRYDSEGRVMQLGIYNVLRVRNFQLIKYFVITNQLNQSLSFYEVSTVVATITLKGTKCSIITKVVVP